MSVTFERMKAHEVEEWRHNDATIHLLYLLQEEMKGWQLQLEVAASTADPKAPVIAGRCRMLRQLIHEIDKAQGGESE